MHVCPGYTEKLANLPGVFSLMVFQSAPYLLEGFALAIKYNYFEHYHHFQAMLIFLTIFMAHLRVCTHKMES